MENYIYYPPGPSELESLYSRYVPGDYDEHDHECDPDLDRILYTTWLAIAALVGATAFVLWRVVR